MPRKDRKKWGISFPEESKAVQSFKDQCDINRVLDRAKHGASLSHLLNHGGSYGDFSDFNEETYENMLNRISEANSIFNDLPAELRQNEFDNSVGKFFSFVNDPANSDRLEEIFPALAAPGRQFPDVIGGAAAEAAVAAVKELAQPATPPDGGSVDTGSSEPA